MRHVCAVDAAAQSDNDVVWSTRHFLLDALDLQIQTAPPLIRRPPFMRLTRESVAATGTLSVIVKGYARIAVVHHAV
jgi:hypothetical protein